MTPQTDGCQAEFDAFALLKQWATDPRCNVLMSLAWLPLGYGVARWAPWLAFAGAGVGDVATITRSTQRHRPGQTFRTHRESPVVNARLPAD